MSESAKCTGAHYAKWEQKRNLKLAQKRLLKVGPIVNSQPSRKGRKRRRQGRGRSGRHLVGGGASSEEPNQFKRRELKHRAKRLLDLTSDEYLEKASLREVRANLRQAQFEARVVLNRIVQQAEELTPKPNPVDAKKPGVVSPEREAEKRGALFSHLASKAFKKIDKDERGYIPLNTAIEVLQLYPQQNQVEAFVGDDPTYGKGHVGLDVFLKVFRFTLGQSLRLLGKASESEMAKAAERDEKRGNASTIIQAALRGKFARAACKLMRKEELHRRKSAIRLQAVLRGRLSRRQSTMMRELLQKEEERKKREADPAFQAQSELAAIKIQSRLRGNKARRRSKMERENLQLAKKRKKRAKELEKRRLAEEEKRKNEALERAVAQAHEDEVRAMERTRRAKQRKEERLRRKREEKQREDKERERRQQEKAERIEAERQRKEKQIQDDARKAQIAAAKRIQAARRGSLVRRQLTKDKLKQQKLDRLEVRKEIRNVENREMGHTIKSIQKTVTGQKLLKGIDEGGAAAEAAERSQKRAEILLATRGDAVQKGLVKEGDGRNGPLPAPVSAGPSSSKEGMLRGAEGVKSGSDDDYGEDFEDDDEIKQAIPKKESASPAASPAKESELGSDDEADLSLDLSLEGDALA